MLPWHSTVLPSMYLLAGSFLICRFASNLSNLCRAKLHFRSQTLQWQAWNNSWTSSSGEFIASAPRIQSGCWITHQFLFFSSPKPSNWATKEKGKQPTHPQSSSDGFVSWLAYGKKSKTAAKGPREGCYSGRCSRWDAGGSQDHLPTRQILGALFQRSQGWMQSWYDILCTGETSLSCSPTNM